MSRPSTPPPMCSVYTTNLKFPLYTHRASAHNAIRGLLHERRTDTIKDSDPIRDQWTEFLGNEVRSLIRPNADWTSITVLRRGYNYSPSRNPPTIVITVTEAAKVGTWVVLTEMIKACLTKFTVDAQVEVLISKIFRSSAAEYLEYDIPPPEAGTRVRINGSNTMGTVGGYVSLTYEGYEPLTVGVSCHHVLGGKNTETHVLQKCSDGTEDIMGYVTASSGYPLRPESECSADWALVSCQGAQLKMITEDPESASARPPPLRKGTEGATVMQAGDFMVNCRAGRSRTYGWVNAIPADCRLPNSLGLSREEVIIGEGQSIFSQPGDSGSFVRSTSNDLAGMVLGGNMDKQGTLKLTYVTQIAEVFSDVQQRLGCLVTLLS
ncbi:MAG: hypothetical protein M1829_000068 [Trizodia sp. TS-e1964]|nr:MAG: hypothetical protein M1829_000068 [Trizodia sp. TS-e1964]